MAIDRLTLEFPTQKRKQAALEFIREFNEENAYPYGTNELHTVLQPSGRFESYESWLECCNSNRVAKFSITGVPTVSFFIIRKLDDRIVGMITVRLKLNDSGWNNNGNIEYCIRKSERGKDYAKSGLFLALEFCYKHGIEAVLLKCDQDDYTSKHIIRALGAKLLREKWSDMYQVWYQFFIIDVTESVARYLHEYMNHF